MIRCTSSWVTVSSAKAGSIIACPFFRKAFESGNLSHELSKGDSRTAQYGLTWRDIAHQASLGADACAGTDLQVTGQAGLSSGHDKIAKLGAARDPDLAGKNAAP